MMRSNRVTLSTRLVSCPIESIADHALLLACHGQHGPAPSAQ